MSSPSGIVLLIVAIVLIVIIAYLISVILRKKNDGLIAALEERQQTLFAIPLAEEVAEIDRLQLVGQSLESFEDWKMKWFAISQGTFKTIEESLDAVQNYNDTFNFFKTKKELVELDNLLSDTQEKVQVIQEGLAALHQQEEKNSGRVKYALDMYEELQESISTQEGLLGPALPEINKQLKNIQSEFSQFVALNSSGDPIEAANLLEKAEEHTIALGQISEQIPDLVKTLQEVLPDQLEDLETGYAKLIEENYQFGDQPIESRFQMVREAINATKQSLAELELEKVQQANEDIQERLTKLYDLFEKEIAAHHSVQKAIKRLPEYLEHAKSNQDKLNDELQRLLRQYILDDTEVAAIKGLTKELDKLEVTVLPSILANEVPEKPYSELDNLYSKALASLGRVEEDQLAVLEQFRQVEKDEASARQLVDEAVNRLHTIKRFMEKRHLPGIPQEFLSLFFTTSSQLEALMTELGRGRIDIQMVSRLKDAATQAMLTLEETAYRVIQEATLTEQLLQYSNRYRSFEPAVQTSFETAYQLFEGHHDYHAAFEEISYALELVEPGVTDRFVNSYEKTRETIRF